MQRYTRLGSAAGARPKGKASSEQQTELDALGRWVWSSSSDLRSTISIGLGRDTDDTVPDNAVSVRPRLGS